MLKSKHVFHEWDEIININTRELFVITHIDAVRHVGEIWHTLSVSDNKTHIYKGIQLQQFKKTGREYTKPSPILFRYDEKYIQGEINEG